LSEGIFPGTQMGPCCADVSVSLICIGFQEAACFNSPISSNTQPTPHPWTHLVSPCWGLWSPAGHPQAAAWRMAAHRKAQLRLWLSMAAVASPATNSGEIW